MGYGPFIDPNAVPNYEPPAKGAGFWDKFKNLNSGGKVIGMQPDEFAMMFGRLASAIAPNTVAGRMGEQVAQQGQYLNQQRREDEKPENVIAKARLKSAQDAMLPKQDASSFSLKQPMTFNQAPASSLQVSDPRLSSQQVAAPNVVNPLVASASMQPAGPAPVVPQTLSESLAMQDARTREMGMLPYEVANAKLAPVATQSSIDYHNANTGKTQAEIPWIGPQAKANVTEAEARANLFGTQSKILPQELDLNKQKFAFEKDVKFPVESRLRSMEISSIDQARRAAAEDRDLQRVQMLDLKVADRMLKHETGVAGVFQLADKHANQAGANPTLIGINAIKDAVPRIMSWLDDAKALKDPNAKLAAGNALYSAYTRGVAAINNAVDAKEAKAAHRALLNSLSVLSKSEPELYQEMVRDLPTRLGKKGTSRYIPTPPFLPNIPVGGTNWEYDPQVENSLYFGGKK